MFEKTLESPLDWKEIQPIHPKGCPGCSLEALMLKLKLQYFGHLMGRVDSLEKTLMLGGIGGGGEGMASPTRWTWVWVNSRSLWWTGRSGVLRFMGSQRVRQEWATELNWTELMVSITIHASTSSTSTSTSTTSTSLLGIIWWLDSNDKMQGISN